LVRGFFSFLRGNGGAEFFLSPIFHLIHNIVQAVCPPTGGVGGGVFFFGFGFFESQPSLSLVVLQPPDLLKVFFFHFER